MFISILITHTKTHLNKLRIKFTVFFKNKSYLLLFILILVYLSLFIIFILIIVNICSFNGLLHGKLSSVSNLIFMKSLPYSASLPPFIVLISFLMPSQSSVYFSSTFLFASVESKTKYLLPFFLQYVHLLRQ